MSEKWVPVVGYVRLLERAFRQALARQTSVDLSAYAFEESPHQVLVRLGSHELRFSGDQLTIARTINGRYSFEDFTPYESEGWRDYILRDFIDFAKAGFWDEPAPMLDCVFAMIGVTLGRQVSVTGVQRLDAFVSVEGLLDGNHFRAELDRRTVRGLPAILRDHVREELKRLIAQKAPR